MNKETRTFIWGLILLLFSSGAFGIHMIRIMNGTLDANFLNISTFVLTILGMLTGALKINKTTD